MDTTPQLLVVDDDADLCANIQDILEGDHLVETAYSGQEALALCREGTYDVILVDLRLPDMSGVEVVEEVVKRAPSTAFIYITGHASLDSAMQAVHQDQVVSYETKPLNLTRLQLTIAQILQHQRTEKALQESEELFSTIGAAAQDAILMMDDEGKIAYWNRAAERILGWSSPEALGKELHTFLAPPRYHDAYCTGFARCRQTGEGPAVGQTLELAAVRKDGTEIPIELSASAVQLQGKWHAVGILRDISVRKQRAEVLRKSEEQFRIVAEYTYDWETWVGPEGDYLYISPSCERITGYRPDEFRADPGLLEKIVHPDDRAVVARHIHEEGGIETQETGSMEFRLTARSGEERWVEHLCQPVYSAAGEYLGRRASNRDITQRKKTEEHVRRQDAVLEAINRVFRETLVCETEEEVARTCLAVAEELTGSRFGLIGEINAAGLFDTLAISNPGWEECNMPESEATRLIKDMEIRGVDRSILREGTSRIVNDPASHPDAVGLPPGHPPVRAFLGVPLKQAGKTMGMIGLANKEGGYVAADQEAIENLALAFEEALRTKRAEQALRQREAQYRVLFESASIGIGIADRQGQLIAFNEAMLRPGGYSREDMDKIGTIANLYVDPDARAKALALAESHGVLDQHRVQFKRKDGTLYDALLSLRPVQIQGQTCWQATVQDITAEVRTKAERDRLFDLPTTLIMIAQPDGTIVRTSAGWENVLGYSSADMAGRSFLDFIHPDDVPASRAGTEDVASGVDIHHFENRYRHRDGTYRVLLWTASADPKTGLHYGVAQDITAHKHQEMRQQALRQARETVQEMEKPADIGQLLIAVRDSLKLLEVPFHWCGINVMDESSDPSRVHFHNMGRDGEWRLEEGAMASRLVAQFWRAAGPVYRRDLAAADPYQEREHFSEEVRAVLDVPFSHGTLALSSPEPAAFSEEDIASLEALAGVLSEGFQRLDDLQILQTTEEQLRQAQKMEAIGQLAGGVAHDFNNLITIITGYCQLLLKGLDPDDPRRAHIEQINQAGDRAATLVRQLLAFSRKQVLQPRVLNLNEIVEHTQKMLGRLLGEDIELAAILDPQLGQVHADPGQLEQVLMNLAVNARDAMPHGGQLTIETANVELDEAYARRHAAVQPGFYVMVAVSDTGSGMDAETQAHLFEPFFTTKEAGKGTGLGLATVYGIVKQSEGSIWVYSEPGQGTTFKIYLPRVDQPGKTVGEEQAPQAVPRGAETILVVEDEEALRELACLTLREYGYTVLEASQGDEALQLFAERQAPVDLLVTDVVMPGLSGPELAEQLTSRQPQMKVLYTSGYMSHAIVRDGVLKAGTPFLPKPFNPDDLARKVREVLDTPREERA